MIITPDMGHSDLWHLNFSLKFLFGKALHEGYLPLWSKDLGTGFPLAGEGQTGMFNLLNLLSFRFFDPVTAFNLSFLGIFIILATGTYFFGRLLKLTRLAAFFLTVIFSLNGFFITHATHFNLIQAAAFLPWQFFLAEKFFQTQKKRWLIVFALVLSQQITAGFQQMVLIPLVALGLYTVLRTRNFRHWFWLGIFTFLGVFLAAPQILASVELVQSSFRSGLSVLELVRFPYPPMHLLTFFYPYLLGDPRSGTYQFFNENWGIFWESTAYLGVIPVTLAIISLFFKKTSLAKIFIIIGIVSLILLLGKSTPLFFIFQIPPLSLFRVPARFLLPFAWSLAILAALFLDKIKNFRLKTLLIIISIIDVGYFAFTYHAWLKNPQEWLEPPESVKILSQDKNWFRVYSPMPGKAWNEIYFSSGWQDIEKYKPFRSALDANQNLLWNISSLDYYRSGLTSRRQQIWTKIFTDGNGTFVKKKSGEVILSKPASKILSLAGVKYLIFPLPIEAHEELNLSLIATISGKPNFYIYQNGLARPHAYLTTNYQLAKDIPDLINKTSDIASSAVVLEKPTNIVSEDQNAGNAEVVKNEDLEVAVKVNASTKAILILTDSYYPGWEAYVDGERVEILPANLNQRAVIVPEGRHEVNFYYRPFSLDRWLSKIIPIKNIWEIK